MVAARLKKEDMIDIIKIVSHGHSEAKTIFICRIICGADSMNASKNLSSVSGINLS